MIEHLTGHFSEEAHMRNKGQNGGQSDLCSSVGSEAQLLSRGSGANSPRIMTQNSSSLPVGNLRCQSDLGSNIDSDIIGTNDEKAASLMVDSTTNQIQFQSRSQISSRNNLNSHIIAPSGRNSEAPNSELEKLDNRTELTDTNCLSTRNSSYQDYPEEFTAWSFDIFKYEIKFGPNTMTEVGANILCREYNIGALLNIEDKDIIHWLSQIEDKYYYDLPYHNCIHGTDALQATASLLTQLNSHRPNFLTRFQQCALLIAATAHDVGHPGKTSGYLINTGNELAALYSNKSVLENYHNKLLWDITFGKESDCNILRNLPRTLKAEFQKQVTQCILATDMFEHKDTLQRFKMECNNGNEPGQGIVQRMIIKIADISNPARDFKTAKIWAKRISEEYFSQTEVERLNNLPISMPNFDREKCARIEESQYNFAEFIQEMYVIWNIFVPCEEILTNLVNNTKTWKERISTQYDSDDGEDADQDGPHQDGHIIDPDQVEELQLDRDFHDHGHDHNLENPNSDTNFQDGRAVSSEKSEGQLEWEANRCNEQRGSVVTIIEDRSNLKGFTYVFFGISRRSVKFYPQKNDPKKAFSLRGYKISIESDTEESSYAK